MNIIVINLVHIHNSTGGFWFFAYKKHSSSQFPRYLSHSMPVIQKAVMSSMTDTFNNLSQSPTKPAQPDLQKTWDSILPKPKNDQLPSLSLSFHLISTKPIAILTTSCQIHFLHFSNVLNKNRVLLSTQLLIIIPLVAFLVSLEQR